MGDITVKIENDNTEEIKQAVQDAVLVALDAAGLQGATLARRELQNNPPRIDTGLLRNSVTHAVSGKPAAISTYRADTPKKGRQDSGSYSGSAPAAADPQKPFVLIGTNVEYAGYVHEGTSNMAPNRFIKNALETNQAELEKIIRTVLRKLMS